MAFKNNTTVLANFTTFLASVQDGDEGEFLAQASYFRDLFDAIVDALNTGVDTADVNALAITAGLLAADAVQTLKIQDGAVTAPKLATAAVTLIKMAAASVDRDKLVVAGDKGISPLLDHGLYIVSPTWYTMTAESDGLIGGNIKHAVLTITPTTAGATMRHTAWPMNGSTPQYMPFAYLVDKAPLQGGNNTGSLGQPIVRLDSRTATSFKLVLDVHVASATGLYYQVSTLESAAAMPTPTATDVNVFWGIWDLRTA